MPLLAALATVALIAGVSLIVAGLRPAPVPTGPPARFPGLTKLLHGQSAATPVHRRRTAVLAGALAGRAVVPYVDQVLFERVTLAFTLVAAVRLLV